MRAAETDAASPGERLAMPMPHPEKVRILFVEDSVGLSGSTMSLCQLLANLDHHRYEAHVVFSRAEQQEYLRSSTPAQVDSTVIAHRNSLQHTRGVERLARAARAIHARAERLVRTPVALCDVLFVTVPYVIRLTRFGRRKRIDFIHHNNGFYLALVLLGWLLRVPIIAYQRGPEWNSPTVRRLVKYITIYCANSEATRQDLLALGVAPERIHVVYPPLDLARLALAGEPDATRRSFDLDASQPTFGIVGLLVEWKGQAVFLRAARRVLDALPHARAFIIGRAPVGGEAYADQLHRLARDLAIDDRVVFTGFRQDVPALLNVLDVVVHASVTPEPFGRVIVEAMAMGKPVIATSAGGPLEIIDPEHNGFLVPPGDDEALAEKIVQLLRDRELAAAVGRRARTEVIERFSVSAHANRMREIYAMVLRGGRGKSLRTVTEGSGGEGPVEGRMVDQ